MTTELKDESALEFFEDFENLKTVQADINNLKLSAEDHPFTLSLRVNDLGSDKEVTKFINAVKSMIRSSPEYKEWTNYIREVLGETVCKVTGEFHDQTKVDIHHHPASITSIVKAVVFKQMFNQEDFCSSDIVLKVLELHFQNRIGYCPLVKSIHEKFHAGFLLIPMDLVSGNYQYFLDNYLSYLDDDSLQTISERVRINWKNCGWKRYFWGNPNGQIDDK